MFVGDGTVIDYIYSSPEDSLSPFFMFWEQRMLPGYSDKLSNLFVYLKIVRISGGSCEWMLPEHSFTLSVGDYIVFNNVDPRAITTVFDGEPLVIEQAIILPTSFSPVLMSPDFFYLYRDYPVIRPEAPYYDCIDSAFRELSREARSKDKFADHAVCGAFLSLAAYIARSFAETRGTDADVKIVGSVLIPDIMRFISDNVSDPELNITAIAKHFGQPRALLSSAFSRYAGMSVAKYIRLVRVQNVILLLGRKKKNVLEAALECGFNSSSGFYKTFESLVGMSPLEALKDSASLL